MWFCFKNKGVQPLLNAVIDFLPSPLDVPAYLGFKPGDVNEEEILKDLRMMVNLFQV